MIGMLSGVVRHNNIGSVILDASGTGYKVAVTLEASTRLPEGTTAVLWTHLAVRENALDLYGFLSRDELIFFELLLSVSGIGPKSALSILSIADVATLSRAIGEGDSTYLTRVSGIGKKSAEKIVLELRDKLHRHVSGETSGTLQEEADVLEALETLGYARKDAREALKSVASTNTDAKTRLKEALKILGKK